MQLIHLTHSCTTGGYPDMNHLALRMLYLTVSAFCLLMYIHFTTVITAGSLFTCDVRRRQSPKKLRLSEISSHITMEKAEVQKFKMLPTLRKNQTEELSFSFPSIVIRSQM